MEKFVFDYYKESIKRIRCYYTYNGIVDDTTYWEGYILTKNVDGALSIEGFEKDKMDSTSHPRYVYGNKAISYANNSLSFNIYPGKIPPIYYDMHYNQEDNCFYGYWHLIPSTKHRYPSNHSGNAIIYIEDVNVDEKDIMKYIEEVAANYKHEYDEEIKMNEYMAHMQVTPHRNNYSSAVRKLSNLSSKIKVRQDI